MTYTIKQVNGKEKTETIAEHVSSEWIQRFVEDMFNELRSSLEVESIEEGDSYGIIVTAEKEKGEK